MPFTAHCVDRHSTALTAGAAGGWIPSHNCCARSRAALAPHSRTPLPAVSDLTTPFPLDAAPARRAADRATDRATDRAADRASDRPAGPGDGRVPRPDRALHLLLLAAERESRVGVTICAAGVTVSGRLVSTRAFGRALADQFTTVGGMTEMDPTFAESLRDLVDDAIDVAQGDRRASPDAAAYEHATAFVNVADARVVTGAGLLPAGRSGVLWRCRVADVQGWALGELTGG